MRTKRTYDKFVLYLMVNEIGNIYDQMKMYHFTFYKGKKIIEITDRCLDGVFAGGSNLEKSSISRSLRFSFSTPKADFRNTAFSKLNTFL